MPETYAYTTPKYLLPQMEDVPATEPAFYRSLFILDRLGPRDTAAGDGPPPTSNIQELTAPIDPFDGRGEEFETLPAVGALTVHQQGWVQKGIALGNLIQSICLAPGEVTQVAVIDWRRTTTGTSEEATQQGETVTSDISQQRAVNEVQRAVAEEAQRGGSSTSATSAALQSGLAVSTLVASGSVSSAVNTSSALTAQFSTGSRNLAADSTNALSQQTAERSSALRSRRTSMVREVSEKESETLSTRVLANYNRRHALNVEYFEVLQLYEIKTELAGWERCLFVPLKPVDFTVAKTITAHKPVLTTVLAEMGRMDLVDRLRDQFNAAAKKEQVQEEILQLEAALADIPRRSALIGAIDHALQDIGVLAQAKALRDGGTPRPLERVLQHYAGLTKQFPDLFTGDIETESATKLAERRQREASLRDAALARVGAADAGFAREQKLNEARERVRNLKEELVALDVTLGQLLSMDRLFLSQQLWIRMDAYKIYRMLAAYKIDGKSLSMLVDPHPVGLFGNYLAFRWGFARSEDGKKERTDFEKKYLKQDNAAPPVKAEIALPTSGVFAEAVLGRGEAAEIKDDTRLWRWKEEAEVPILPPKIAEIASRDRAKPMELRPADFAASLAALRASDPANLSYISEAMRQISNGGMFRNMGGLSEAVGLAEKLASLSGSGASEAGKRAQEIHAKLLDTFVDVLNSDVGKAAVSEFMLPGSGAAFLSPGGGRRPGGDGRDGRSDRTGKRDAADAEPDLDKLFAGVGEDLPE